MSDTTGVGTAVAVSETHLPETRPAETRLADGRFAPGHSGNPLGRPLGSRHKATLAAEALLSGEAEALSGKVIALALSGDSTALRLCIERLIPRLRARPVSLDLPLVRTTADISDALTVVVGAAATGEIDAAHARDMAILLESKRKSLESIEIHERLQIVEKKLSRDQSGL
jgi:hypothetical protein